MKLIGKRLLLSPSLSRVRGSIFIPDYLRESTSICKVVSRGGGVQSFIKQNDTVLCQKGFADRDSLTIGNCFFCNEWNIFAVLVKGQIMPTGRRVLIRRDIKDKYEGSIVIPENRRFQSLFGTVERFGITREPFRYADLKKGDYIQLKEWSQEMIEIELEDGGYGLIVKEEDILYKYE